MPAIGTSHPPVSTGLEHRVPIVVDARLNVAAPTFVVLVVLRVVRRRRGCRPGGRRLRRSGVRVATVLVTTSRGAVVSTSPREVSPSASCPRRTYGNPRRRTGRHCRRHALRRRRRALRQTHPRLPTSTPRHHLRHSASLPRLHRSTAVRDAVAAGHVGAVGEAMRTRLTLADGVVLSVVRAHVVTRARRVAVGVVLDVRRAAVVSPRQLPQSGSRGYAAPCRTRCRRPIVHRVARYPSTPTPNPSWSASFEVVRARASAAMLASPASSCESAGAP